jgi:hypothetical protein
VHAAAPSWFADNLALIAGVTLAAVTVLVLRVVKDKITRGLIVVLLVGLGVLVYVNRDALETCAETCECEIADQDISVPFCDPNLDLAAAVTRSSPRA